MTRHTWEIYQRSMARAFEPVHYVYLFKDGQGRPVYVGMGRNMRLDTQRRAPCLAGCSGEIIVSGLTRAQALETEGRLIRILGRKGIDPFGLLDNRANTF